MKKKLFSILTSGLLFLICGSGCNFSNVEATVSKNDLGQTTSSGGTLINGFEVFDRDVQLIKLFNEFGRLEKNNDKKYVRSGDSSLHVQPFGGRIKQNTANPFFLLPTTSTRFQELGFGNFTKVDTVTFWIYNAEEEALNVGVGLQVGNIKSVGGAPTYDIVQTTWSEYYSLRSGWNFIEYEILPAELEMQGVSLEAVSGIAFEFDHVWSNDFADAPDLYIDEVCLNYLETEKTGTLDLSITKTTWLDGETERDSWTIFDFESGNASKYFYYAHSFPAPMAGEPVLKHVFAGDYGAIAEDNAQTLLMLLKHGGKQKGECPVMYMYGEVMQAAIKAIGNDIVENPQNYAFRFDMYNGSAVNYRFALEYSGASTWEVFDTVAGEWKTYSVNFGFINSKAKSGNEVFTKAPGAVRFAWSDYSLTENIEDRPFLIDNMRIDKIA